MSTAKQALSSIGSGRYADRRHPASWIGSRREACLTPQPPHSQAPDAGHPPPRAARHRARRGRLLLLGLLGFGLPLALGTWLLWQLPWGTMLDDPEAVREFLAGQGARAPLLFVALQALQVVAAPIPGHFLGVAAGLLFGLWRGTLFSATGVALGSAIVLLIARLFGRPWVRRLLAGDALDRVDHWAARRGPLFFFLIFLLPFLPDDLACFAVGLSPLPLVPMWGLILVARLPGHFLAAWVGTTAGTRTPLAGWGLIFLLAAVLFIVYLRHRARVERWLLARVDDQAARQEDRRR